MIIEEFDYTLPSCLIAQYPSPKRESRLMALHRSHATIEHRSFRDLLNYLHPGDLLVTNDSRVLPLGWSARRRPEESAKSSDPLLERIPGNMGSSD